MKWRSWSEDLFIKILKLCPFVGATNKETLREKCPYSEFFWSVFSCIRTEYGKILPKAGKYGPKKQNMDAFYAVKAIFSCILDSFFPTPADIYLLKVNNRNTRARCEICSKLTINTPERRLWRCSDVFSVNFEHISYLVLVSLPLTLNM